MPTIDSRYFGTFEYSTEEPFIFPNGLPGFPGETSFIPVELPEQFPVVYLQSLHTPGLCFVSLPVKCVLADYRLETNAVDLALIGLDVDARPGPDMLCLALLCFETDGTAAANLRAPIVINVKNRRAVQMIQAEAQYPVRFELSSQAETVAC